MKKTILALCLFFPALLLATDWKINPDHSEILFQVPYLNISQVSGRFKSFSGAATFGDLSYPQEISINIMSTSIDTGNLLRDGHLKSSNFLKANEFPVITFSSKNIKMLKSRFFQATGKLSVAGVTKEKKIDFELIIPVKDTWNYVSQFVNFKLTVNRSDFKLDWNKTLADNKYLVGDKIIIWGTFQLQMAGLKTPTSKHMIPDTNYIRMRERIARGEISFPVPGDLQDLKKEQVGIIHDDSGQPEEQQRAVDLPIVKKDIRDTLVWQVCFWFLGMMGFFASIIIGLFAKKWISEKTQIAYREGGILGILTDVISITFILLFVLAFWEVGWGGY